MSRVLAFAFNVAEAVRIVVLAVAGWLGCVIGAVAAALLVGVVLGAFLFLCGFALESGVRLAWAVGGR